MKEMKDEFKMKILYLCCRKSDRGHWGEAGGAPQELPGARPQQVQQVRILLLHVWASQCDHHRVHGQYQHYHYHWVHFVILRFSPPTCSSITSILTMDTIYSNTTGQWTNCRNQTTEIFTPFLFNSRVPVEERTLNTTANPMCEVFPKVGACLYTRYSRWVI